VSSLRIVGLKRLLSLAFVLVVALNGAPSGLLVRTSSIGGAENAV
jgi:hypothetical protein